MKEIINKKILILISLFLFLLLFVGCFVAPPINNAPTIISTPITTTTVDVLYNYDVDATDPDGSDTLTYALTTSPVGMTINSATGVISWTPSTKGDYDVTVEVSDGELLDTQSFEITVDDPCDPCDPCGPCYDPCDPCDDPDPCDPCAWVADKPTVVTNDFSSIGTTTANGNITATGGENCTVRGFQYGLS